jgi:hypothetical protein
MLRLVRFDRRVNRLLRCGFEGAQLIGSGAYRGSGVPTGLPLPLIVAVRSALAVAALAAISAVAAAAPPAPASVIAVPALASLLLGRTIGLTLLFLRPLFLRPLFLRPLFLALLLPIALLMITRLPVSPLLAVAIPAAFAMLVASLALLVAAFASLAETVAVAAVTVAAVSPRLLAVGAPLAAGSLSRGGLGLCGSHRRSVARKPAEESAEESLLRGRRTRLGPHRP